MQRTHFGRAAATAMAIASLAVAATAATASASTVGPMVDTSGDTAFGNNWQFGTPQLPGILNWQPNGANTTPVLTGNNFLSSSPGVSSRVQLRIYAPNGSLTATRTSPVIAGAAGLIAGGVMIGNVMSTSQHAHIVLRDNRNGNWQDVADVHCTPVIPACV
jgi:hypothetical protein